MAILLFVSRVFFTLAREALHQVCDVTDILDICTIYNYVDMSYGKTSVDSNEGVINFHRLDR